MPITNFLFLQTTITNTDPASVALPITGGRICKKKALRSLGSDPLNALHASMQPPAVTTF
ncbi:UNVERIFIED_CONTAM: hypothetical protein FKN15_061222 [Acipenser sinensis]